MAVEAEVELFVGGKFRWRHDNGATMLPKRLAEDHRAGWRWFLGRLAARSAGKFGAAECVYDGERCGDVTVTDTSKGAPV